MAAPSSFIDRRAAIAARADVAPIRGAALHTDPSRLST